ncbi:MAG: hypothetical protein Tsb0015_01680 [Simkaniaceae bacterium]
MGEGFFGINPVQQYNPWNAGNYTANYAKLRIEWNKGNEKISSAAEFAFRPTPTGDSLFKARLENRKNVIFLQHNLQYTKDIKKTPRRIHALFSAEKIF